MAYTRHGHQIPGTPVEGEKPEKKARCGGYPHCTDCRNDTKLALIAAGAKDGNEEQKAQLKKLIESCCINCGSDLVEVTEGSGEKHKQYRDALHIQVHLGYGTFRDQGPDQVGSPEGQFCHDCATVLETFFPGIRYLLGSS